MDDKLLAKYMAHVVCCEGLSFVAHIGDGWGASSVMFAPDEVARLSKIEADLDSGRWAFWRADPSSTALLSG